MVANKNISIAPASKEERSKRDADYAAHVLEDILEEERAKSDSCEPISTQNLLRPLWRDASGVEFRINYLGDRNKHVQFKMVDLFWAFFKELKKQDKDAGLAPFPDASDEFRDTLLTTRDQAKIKGDGSAEKRLRFNAAYLGGTIYTYKNSRGNWLYFKVLVVSKLTPSELCKMTIPMQDCIWNKWNPSACRVDVPKPNM